MKTAIIIHGMPSKDEYYDPESASQSNKHWLPWIQRQLILKGVLAQTPELPFPFEPEYAQWCAVFNQFKIDEDTMLIGHSCGAGFLARWLSENKIRVGRVAFIAPFIDPDHDEVRSDFFHFEIDPNIGDRTKSLNIFTAPEDDQEILTSAQIIRSTIVSINWTELPGRGHFTFHEMRTVEFPELRDWLLENN